MSVHALILAGGLGSRLGDVRKGDLRIGNQRLIDRVAKHFQDIDGSLLVSIGPNLKRLHWPGTLIADRENRHLGPSSGLAAVVEHLRATAEASDVLLSVAVDTPFLPDDFADMASAVDAATPAAFAGWRDQFYPTNAAYRLGALTKLKDWPHSPKALLQGLGAVRITRWDMMEANPFANINQLADLIALSRRALSPD